MFICIENIRKLTIEFLFLCIRSVDITWHFMFFSSPVGLYRRYYDVNIELQLNKANTSDTEAPFLDLHLSISNGFVPSKIY